jgi:hypothetical protein
VLLSASIIRAISKNKGKPALRKLITELKVYGFQDTTIEILRKK